jgi:hypothetical protein
MHLGANLVPGPIVMSWGMLLPVLSAELIFTLSSAVKTRQAQLIFERRQYYSLLSLTNPQALVAMNSGAMHAQWSIHPVCVLG